MIRKMSLLLRSLSFLLPIGFRLSIPVCWGASDDMELVQLTLPSNSVRSPTADPKAELVRQVVQVAKHDVQEGLSVREAAEKAAHAAADGVAKLDAHNEEREVPVLKDQIAIADQVIAKIFTDAGEQQSLATRLYGQSIDAMDQPCSNVFYFVTGFHHSGTTAMQHELLRRSGVTVTHRFEEKYPEGCPETGSVYKVPTNTVGGLGDKFAWKTYVSSVRDKYPNVITIYMQRDIPNTVWSVYKRPNEEENHHPGGEFNKAFAKKVLDACCDVRCAWETHEFTDNDITVEMADFLAHPDKTFQDIANMYDRLTALLRLPDAAQHEERRAEQAVSDLYDDKPDLFRKEVPDKDVADWIAALSCSKCHV